MSTAPIATTPPALKSVSLFAIKSPDDKDKAATNLLGDGFLRRGQTGLLNGATGIGKSVFITQSALCWCVGDAFFGIKPQKALKVLLVQSENDDADIAEMRDGIVAGIGMDTARQQLAPGQIRIMRSFKSGAAWLAEITPDVVDFKPDLVIVDPLFAFAGVDMAKDQQGLSRFLRELLQKFALDYNLGVILIHHTNKPPTLPKGKSGWQAGDFAYSGSGHNELANFPRYVSMLRSVGSRSVFEFRIGKRWKRAGLVDANGAPTDHFLVKQATEGMHWELATDQELADSLDHSADAPKAKAGEDDARTGALKVHSAFNEFSKKSEPVTLAKMAKKLNVCQKTVRRFFGDDHRLELDGTALVLKDAKITREPQSAGGEPIDVEFAS